MDRPKPMCTKSSLLRLLKSVDLNSKVVLKALKCAERIHKLDTRDDGKPYLTQHIFPLAADVCNYYYGKENLETAVTVTLLHDVPEDSTYSNGQLVTEYGADIARLVMYLQKPRKKKQVRSQSDKHEEHIEFITQLNNAPMLCRVIKCLDRINNLQCTDAQRNRVKYERCVQDTVELYIPFAEAVDINLAHLMKSEVARIIRDLHV